MGAILKLIDAFLFIFFLIIAFAAPLLDSQACFPQNLYPDFLVDLHTWYAREYGDYLMAEKPNFFVGLIWLEILFQWPLALLNLYGILTSKPWFNTTCLIYGASIVSSMLALTLTHLTGQPILSNILNHPSKSGSGEEALWKTMGVLLKLVDTVLFLFLLVLSLSAPLIGSQILFPLSFFPDFLIDLKSWYTHQSGDYLMAETPHFFVGVVWLELLFQWPLTLINLYGILAAKSWFNTTCLIYGVSVLSTMAATLADLIGSHRASDTLLKIYFPFLGLGVLAILRGLVPHSTKTTTIGVRPVIGRKKRA